MELPQHINVFRRATDVLMPILGDYRRNGQGGAAAPSGRAAAPPDCLEYVSPNVQPPGLSALVASALFAFFFGLNDCIEGKPVDQSFIA